MSLLLAHEIIRHSPQQASARSVLFLHGMLARGSNLRSFAKLLSQSLQCDALLVDQRAHGDSGSGAPPHTVHACADDIGRLLPALELAAPTVVVGHSFGGKVACVYADQAAQVRSCVVLDSPPGVWQDVDAEGDSVARLLSVLPTVQVHSRAQVARDLETTHGFSRSVGQWMTTNVKDQGAFCFDLEVCRQLFENYRALDLMPLLTGMRTEKVCFVRAEKNRAWTASVLRDFAELPNPRVSLVTARGLGHWLHAENPLAVRDLVLPYV
jgi:esterase